MMNRLFVAEKVSAIAIAFVLCSAFLFISKPVYAETVSASPEDGLQAVIDGADEGAVITLSEGTYEGPIQVTKPLTIKSEEKAVIDGGKEGNVILVDADNVTIEGLTIQSGGMGKTESGIYLKGGSGHAIRGNTFLNVLNGIYAEEGTGHVIGDNRITSYSLHFSERGSAIYIRKGSGHRIEGNELVGVQDGVYLDETRSIKVRDNEARNSRYGFHFMFSEDIEASGNALTGNITGLMIMDSGNVAIAGNTVTDQYNVRGYGIIVYDSDRLTIKDNEIRRNSTGLSLEKTTDTDILNNNISGNQTGLEFIGANENNVFTENNFIGNVLQSKIAGSEMKLDNGSVGNYWDDYSSIDVTGDGIGEEWYKAGSLYDQLLEKEPYWQLFFESPAIQLWAKAETLFPSIGEAVVYDENPIVEPADLGNGEAEEAERNAGLLFLAVTFIWFSLMLILIGRRKA